MAEYRVNTPELRFELAGETLRARLAGSVAIRSVALRPNGQRWASAAIDVDTLIDAAGALVLPMPSWPSLGDPLAGARALCRAAAIAANTLPPFPVKPTEPAAPNRPRPNPLSIDVALQLEWAAYDAALVDYQAKLVAYNTAKNIYDTALKTLNDALDACVQLHPLPPTLPSLPALPISLSELLT
jgi:hypothetical protein